MAQNPLVVLRNYWRIVRQNPRIPLFTALMMGFFSFVVAHIYKPIPIFKATAKVQVNSPQTLTGSSVAAQLDTLRSVITSYPVLQLAAERLGLFAHSATKEDSTRWVLFLENQIQTNPEGYTNIIGIEATGLTPDETRMRADVIAEVFAEYSNTQKNEKAYQHRLFVEQQREQARLALSIAEDSLQAYQRQRLLTPDRKSKLQQLQSEVRLREGALMNLERAYQDARVREADKNEDVIVLQRAVTPRRETNPTDPMQRAFSGLFIGLLFGTVIVVVRATLSRVGSLEQQIQEAQEKLMAEMEKELQTAHEMQMALMPKEGPQLAGFDLAGRCIPANHVGGDLFQYFHQDGRLAIGLADVTGHAMAAAIPVVMFSGILRSQMGMGGSVEERFGRLNRSLHGTLTGRTFVCLAMGELDLASRLFRFSNSGCPYPYHYRAATGEVAELQVDAYPLGVRPDTTYQAIEVQLEPGDRVVFCSDGIIEATNGAGEMFGFERTAEVVRNGCEEDLPAEALLERIIQEVKAFSQGVPQGDDQTVVVLKVER